MIYQKIRRAGNSYVVTIPREEMEAQGVNEGDMVALDIRRAEMQPALSPRLREAAEWSWKQHEAGYRYLADR
jgi:antitoxin component of MazEF toxin-antitoxin module